MKTPRIFSAFALGLCFLFFTFPTNSEAQFLKKLSKGIEKVNKGLDKVNKGLDKLTTPDGASSSTSSATPVQRQGGTSTTEVPDTRNWKTMEPIYKVPYISGNTKFLKLETSYITDSWFSGVNEGVFSINYNGKFEFWKVTGQRLFAAEWTNPLLKYDDHPVFNGGVCPMVSTQPDANGKKRWHLLYLDGSVKELDPTYKEITGFQDGLALLTQYVNFKNQYYYINTKGEKVFTHLQLYGDDDKAMRPLRCGMRAFLDRNTHLWGFIDAQGKVVLSPQYIVAKDFSEGYTWVGMKGQNTASQGKLVLIDKTGKVVFDSQLEVGKYGYVHSTSDVVDGKFYVVDQTGDNVIYYDLTGKKLGTFAAGQPYYQQHAFVEVDDGALVNGVKLINQSGQIVRHFSFDRMHDISKTVFSPIGTAVYSDMNKCYIHNYKGDILINEYDGEYSDGISGFDNFTADGYARVKQISFNNTNYIGLMNTDAELEWLFSFKDYLSDWIDWPTDSLPRYDTLIIGDTIPKLPQPVDPQDGPIGPRIRQQQQYKVTAKCSPAEGGTAAITPVKSFQYADIATLNAQVKKGWGIGYVSSDAEGYAVPAIGESFAVTTDMNLTVHLIKKDTTEAPPHTHSYQGTKKKMIENKDWSRDVEVYAEISSQPNLSTPYGDKTYGFLTAMFDPSEQISMPDFTAYIFTPPLKICGYQYDEAAQRHWMVLEGGAFAVGNLQVHPEGQGGLAALYFTSILAFNGFSDVTLSARRYRMEMLEYNPDNGEFTCGCLQTFSGQYGWLPAGDERLKIKEKGFFMTATDSGLDPDIFSGVKLKVAPKRNDIHWYPSVKWCNDKEDVLQQTIENLGNSYRSLQTDYQKVFGE